MAIPWQFQYRRQFRWLRDTRAYLYRLTSLARRSIVLEPGCSVALITEEIRKRSGALVVGLDPDLAALVDAKRRSPNLPLVCGDIYFPPFRHETFDAIVFQFFLLWLEDPTRALRIMSILLQKGGSITAMGEPDYGGRIDFPSAVNYNDFIIHRLEKEGADPFIGRKLQHLFRNARFREIQWGLASTPFGFEQAKEHYRSEWEFLSGLSGSRENPQLRALMELEQQALDQGKRSYFMPVFYCTAEKAKRY